MGRRQSCLGGSVLVVYFPEGDGTRDAMSHPTRSEYRTRRTVSVVGVKRDGRGVVVFYVFRVFSSGLRKSDRVQVCLRRIPKFM